MTTTLRIMDGNISLTQTFYCTVEDKKDKSKLICYTHKKSGIFNIGLTNASDVWSTDFTEETFIQFRQKFALKSIEECIIKIRSASVSRSLSVSVQDTNAVLHVGVSPGDLNVTLPRREDPEAKVELRDLLFRMADSLTYLDNMGGQMTPASFSPRKSPHKINTGFEPRRQQLSGQSLAIKKRFPGDSLINPGTRRKRQATGVAFDEDDDDQ
ncbi:hypothetical protein UPYG_G00180190 [Umbra pygmaea]|uniref:Protein PAXX n=1 Tax=Umbra pygmaea TaxID=75934 RepID=A0ABD0WQF8_UMBPY